MDYLVDLVLPIAVNVVGFMIAGLVGFYMIKRLVNNLLQNLFEALKSNKALNGNDPITLIVGGIASSLGIDPKLIQGLVALFAPMMQKNTPQKKEATVWQ